MPKRTDIKKILIIGSGPIVIGQACEFDYSGAQACKALRAEGYEVVLVNSNPATIMTDPELAHRTYIEPLTKEYLQEILARERPDALLPTVGGQTALNLAVELAESGILEKYRVEMIGASLRAIKVAGPKVTPEGLAPHIYQVGESNFSLLWRMMSGMRRHSAADVLPRVAVPTLVLAGGHDVFTPRRVQERMAALVPDSEIVFWEEAGHMLPLEEPSEVAAAIIDFLARRVRSKAKAG